MTTPTGGPYDPTRGPETTPYGQDPYWGAQPQFGGYPYQPDGPYPPGGPYAYPPGGPYPYPPGGPYAYPPGGYAAGAYPPPQFPPAGQQAPSGWPAGPYPPGSPPRGPSSKLPWLLGAGLALLSVIALVTLLALNLDNRHKPTTANPLGPAATASPPMAQPNASGQTATDCTPNVSGGDKPTGDAPISAGKLSFPADAAPGWMPFSDGQTPNLVGAVGVAQEVPGASQWVMQAEVATTNFDGSMDVAAQASKLMQCVANGPGYEGASPTLGPTKTSSITVDGVKAARVDADVTVEPDPSRNVKGDSLTVIAVDTKPVSVFVGTIPIGDAGAADTLNKVISALKVEK